MSIFHQVVVRFARRRPSPAELMAVRRHDPRLRDQPIPYVREVLMRASKDDWTYHIECVNQAEVEVTVAALRAAGVTADVADRPGRFFAWPGLPSA